MIAGVGIGDVIVLSLCFLVCTEGKGKRSWGWLVVLLWLPEGERGMSVHRGPMVRG